jgi:hypothetical protein
MSSNRTSLRFIVLGALFLGAAAVASSAQAQSCSDPNSVHSSYPVDGAMGVPTNTPVFLYGSDLTATTHDVTLEGGTGDVSFEVQATEGGLLVDAFLGFAPSTAYELTVTPRAGGDVWSATFTTGTGPATLVQLEAPDVTVSVIDQEQGSCGVVSAICVNGSVPARMTFEAIVGGEVVSLGGGQPVPVFLPNSGNVASNGCVDVRVREPGGNVSPTTRVCGSALGRFELADGAAAPRSCQPYNVVPSGEDDGDSDLESSDSGGGGCTLSAPGTGSGAGGLLLGLSALLAAQQRRRVRR